MHIDQDEGIFRLRNVNILGFYYLFNCATCFGHSTIFKQHIFLGLTLLTTDPLIIDLDLHLTHATGCKHPRLRCILTPRRVKIRNSKLESRGQGSHPWGRSCSWWACLTLQCSGQSLNSNYSFAISTLYLHMFNITITKLRFRGFCLTQHCFNSCLLFYPINRYMFRSYKISAWRWS
jgi:hypothetical protein